MIGALVFQLNPFQHACIIYLYVDGVNLAQGIFAMVLCVCVCVILFLMIFFFSIADNFLCFTLSTLKHSGKQRHFLGCNTNMSYATIRYYYLQLFSLPMHLDLFLHFHNIASLKALFLRFRVRALEFYFFCCWVLPRKKCKRNTKKATDTSQEQWHP